MLPLIQPALSDVKGLVWGTSHLYLVDSFYGSLYLHVEASQHSEASLGTITLDAGLHQAHDAGANPKLLECSAPHTSMTVLPLHCPLATSPSVASRKPIQRQETVVFVVLQNAGAKGPQDPPNHACVRLASHNAAYSAKNTVHRSGQVTPCREPG